MPPVQEEPQLTPKGQHTKAATQSAPALPAARQGWSLPRRIAFRFLCAYFFLYSFPFPVGLIPFTERIAEAYDKLWLPIVPWVGKHILNLNREISGVPNGSGDTTYAYIQNLCLLALAIVATALWSALSRRREHTKLDHALRIYVRYVLAFTMLSYGMLKVFKSQFPTPTPMRLMQPIGDSSPMGLLWTFMGYSTAYTIFSGAAEVLGGALLLFRRTTTLGALLLIAVIGNVVALNFCYDVPVKLYSVNLWLMSLFLLLADLPRLACILVFNRSTAAARMYPDTTRPVTRRLHLVVKALIVGLILYTTTRAGYESWKNYGDGAIRDSLDGGYEVEQFSRNGTLLPATLNEPGRWRRIGISTRGRFVVRTMADSTYRYRLEHDVKQRTLAVWLDTSATKDTLTYVRTDSDHLALAGVLLGDSLRVQVRKISFSEFPLMNRGFHWINEAPYNR
jgi:uncharacterized membrane protein YphA (DoxX/SURF4 family)